jgi:hypothetical protein
LLRLSERSRQALSKSGGKPPHSKAALTRRCGSANIARGMTSSALDTAPRASEVSTTGEELIVHLADGRTIIVPLSWYPRLLDATPEQRSDFRLLGDGEYIHWPQVDEDLSISGLLRGTPAPRAGR